MVKRPAETRRAWRATGNTQPAFALPRHGKRDGKAASPSASSSILDLLFSSPKSFVLAPWRLKPSGCFVLDRNGGGTEIDPFPDHVAGLKT
jgi:hypothetical protein